MGKGEEKEMVWINGLPKVELHCHLDGSIPVPVLKRLCLMEAVEVPGTVRHLRELDRKSVV